MYPVPLPTSMSPRDAVVSPVPPLDTESDPDHDGVKV